MTHSEIVSFLWGVADLIRDTFKRGKYQDVILPLTVLRRLDCVLAPSKEKVLRRKEDLRGKGLQDLDAQLRRASGFAFYNTSRYDFDKLRADAPQLAANLRNYIAGFSPNMREVLERFDFDNTISKLNEAGLLFKVLERFKAVDLHPGVVDNATMGTIFDGDTRTVTRDGVKEEAVVSKIFPTTHFGFRKITVERPLRLNFHATPARLARLEHERGFLALAQSKKESAAGAKEQAAGREQQEAIRALLRTLPPTLYKDRRGFETALEAAARSASVKMASPVARAILAALSERDESAAICRDPAGAAEPDPELRDTESVPLAEPVEAFFEREVKPHVPDAWIDTARRDDKDGQVGIVGYEINFNRYFYRYTPPRPLEQFEADIKALEKDIVRMLAEVTGTTARDVVE
ncbi:MAG TPA: type I restriction-modification system subunit M N-terminal domain-containing protein [Methylomirabilota bacterium]|jgi:hypothetical protein|nr:type I restriction-modification system subunit M N-terminal domain-containing protein [Methylomirabilota bacterium]